ncbi:hypothetical protein HMN09_00648200 [Mycena chlorophos]|uniref:DUF605-domain-containing protein n=1 Tax=Mycena chlorophos TaxID=658473 RepID=A0A8H6T629_MYCCL|nr:hypothetical protein HMN09_00648200 [Mycena chlorophos]
MGVAVPAPLKSISPYLQRADELRTQDPVVAYWCTYFAAQVGISLKAKDAASRDFLFELLGNLEKMKEQIGPNDAIDIESVSAAYVENFALRVFAMADNEDRSGAGNRSTAKKFLAAANFLELLKTFPKTEATDGTEEKIKYAKWKAADIAKAFREGRKPTPGPAGSDPSIDAELLQLQQATGPTSARSNISVAGTLKAATPPAPSIALPGPDPGVTDNQFATQTQTPPPRPNAELHPGSWGGQQAGEATPGSWSTAATPGNEKTPQDLPLPDSPTANKGQSSNGTANGGALLTPDLEQAPPTKSVHFSPSVADSTTISTPPLSPPAAWSQHNMPPGFIPDANQPGMYPSAPPPDVFNPVPQPVVPPPPTPPTFIAPPPPRPPPVQLTPMVIAKAQKHCRFAISALDYEDVEQARKELRAALAAIGG